jgi:hypothetical protein
METQKTVLPENIYEFYLLCVEVLKKKSSLEDGWFKYSDDIIDMSLSEDGADLMVVRKRTNDILLFLQKHNPKMYSMDYVFVDDHLKGVLNKTSAAESP